ncbi:MAG TPA: histidine kinase [Panacibacter sp.]|nr:histidine kinase [Panacibacter sp.]
MLRIILCICFCMFFVVHSFAQDTIVLNGEPNWKSSFDIADKSLFYEEPASNETLSFEDAKKQAFVPFTKEFQHAVLSQRPLIIQWFTFTIHNTSATDTLRLRVSLAPHYFIRLYNNDTIIARSGAYETTAPAFQGLPLMVLPQATNTFWVRTEDRQNQFLPPTIALETDYTFMVKAASGIYTDRYLFLLLAAMAGCLFFISVYAMYQFYLYRDKAFLWYIAYTISSLITCLFWIDIRHSLGLFPALVHDIMLSVFLFLVPAMYSLFIGSMLQLPVHFKKGWLIVKVLVGIAFIQMLIEFTTVRTGWFLFNSNYYGYFISIIPVAILHIVLLILTAKSKSPIKWFLFSGLISLLFLWCLPMTRFFFLLSSTSPEFFMIIIFIPAYLLLGLTIEAIFFSFALSYRSKLVLIEKNNMQQAHGLQLEAALQKRTIELEEQSKLVEAQKIAQVHAAFEQKIAETEMTALRAQMNPHFIFNCLNSIKLYTLENDSATASEYLTIFSQLIRLVLENSHSEKVTLKKELETLQLYIQLEAMRFKNKIQYQINVAESIDQEYIEIPPLLLQPYVENAIWHGLMHKKKGGSIVVDVTHPSEHLLRIEITDDGVGRALAAEYKSKSATRQKSFGLKMTSDRIHIINQLYQIQADVKIYDLKDRMNNATGTKVIIQIPV